MTKNAASVGEIPLGVLLDSWKNLFRYLVSKWYIILIFGFLGGVAGISWAWLTKPKYTASLLFALEDNSGGLGGALSLAAEFGLNIGSGKDVFAGENILQIMTTRSIIESVLLKPDTLESKKIQPVITTWMQLNKMDEEFRDHKRLAGVGFSLGQPREQFTYLQDSLLYLVYKDMVTTHLLVNKPDKKLNIYQVEFTSNNERFSKIFNEKVVDETIRYYTELRSKRSLETLRILESRVEQLKGSVGQAIDSRANVQDINLNPAFARAQAPIQRSQFNITAYGAAYTELFKNLELARYQYLKEIPLLQVIESPHYPLEYKKPGRLKSGIIGAFIAGTITALVLAFMMFGKPKEPETVKPV